MIWLVLLLLAVGMFLSAFFSGSETGFYRVSRVRLVLDGLGGDRIARALLWLSNNPALFVATTLVGNNVANYLTSLALVLATQWLPIENVQVVEFLAPVMLSPIVFVYGELLPKKLFFLAPNRMLRRGGPLFLLFTGIFLPASTLLWALGRVLQSLLGQTPLRVQLTLARKELQEVLQEGQEAGILQPAQRRLAQSLVAIATGPVSRFSVPLPRVAAVRPGQRKAEVFRLARRQTSACLPVQDPTSRRLIGYVRVVDLALQSEDQVTHIEPLVEIRQNTPHVTALIRMRSEKADLAVTVDDRGQQIGILYAAQLAEPLVGDD